MTAYTSLLNGPPTAGVFSKDDTYTDGQGVTYHCVSGGYAAPAGYIVSGKAIFDVDGFGNNAGATQIAAVTTVEQGAVAIHNTLLTLSGAVVAVADATQFGGTKIYTFPEGRILVLGVTATLTPTTTSAIASTINSGVAGAASLGTATASAISLTGTMADILPSTAIVTSTTINVAAAAVTGALASSAQFDGTSAAKSVFLNTSITTATDIDADGTIAYSGTVRIVWVFLGDL